MKKRMLASLLCLCLMAGLLPVTAWASGETCTDPNCAHEAAIGENHYDTLAQALDAASPGNEILVLRDLTSDTKLTVDRPVTIKSTLEQAPEIAAPVLITADVALENLRFTWGYVEAGNLNKTVQVGGEAPRVRIADCTIVNTANKLALHIGASGAAEVTLDHTDIIADYNGAWSQAITVLSPGCRLDVLNGSSVSAKYYYGIVNYAKDATINIRDSKVSAWGAIYLKYNDAAYSGSGSTVNIESSEIEGVSPHGYGASNPFAAVIFERVENCTVNVDRNSSVVGAGEHNAQSIVSFQFMYDSTDPNPSNNTFNLHGTAQIMNPEQTDSFISYDGNGTTDPSNRVFVFDTAKFLVEDRESAWIETDENGAFLNAYTTPARARIGERQFQTLSAAVAAAKSGDTVVLLRDVTQSGMLVVGKTMTLDLGGKTLTSTNASYAIAATAGTLTVRNGTIESTTEKGTPLYAQKATIVVDSGAVIRAKNNAVQVGNCVEEKPGEYWGHVTVKDGAYIQGNAGVMVTGPYPVSALQADGTLSQEQKSRSTLTVTGGTIVGYGYGITGNGTNHGTEITVSGGTVRATGEGGGALYHPQNGVLNISGDASFEGPSGVQLCSGMGVVANITGGRFSAFGADQREDKTNDGFIPDGAALSVVNRGYPGGTPKMRVSGGYFSALQNDAVLAYNWSEDTASPWEEAGQYITVEDGYFTSDPSAYVPKDRTAMDSGRPDYPFTIGLRGDKAVPVAAGAPAVKEPTVTYPEEPEKAALLEQAKAALEAEGAAPTAAGAGLEAAAKSQANQNTTTVTEEIVAELDAAVPGSTVTEAATHIVVQHYVEMTIAGVDTTEGKKSVTLDIQPMYRTVATTVNVEEEPEKEIVLDPASGSPVNGVVIGEPKALTVSGPVKITFQLPDGFTTDGKDLVVRHEKDGRLVGYHRAEYDPVKKTITFTNDKGFSSFTVLGDSRSAAIRFTDKDGGPMGDAATYGPAQVNDALPVLTGAQVPAGQAFSGWRFQEDSGPIEGAGGIYTVLTEDLLTALSGKTVTAVPCFYTPSGPATYSIAVEDTKNGAVTVSHRAAAQGAAVTIAVKPEEGYKLDRLTVTGAGGSIALTHQGGGNYAFVMPGGSVTVSASFVREDGTHDCPSARFTDVDLSAWYHEGLDFAVENGLMNGTGATTFSPEKETTRGMLVTILYRMEHEPAVSGEASFEDVAPGSYYEKAVQWAAANGIVNGHSSSRFAPDDAITREQLAAVLYRYAAYRGRDVSGAADLSAFTDVAEVSDYARAAVRWAVDARLIQGTGGSRLSPRGSAVRAQAATILMRFNMDEQREWRPGGVQPPAPGNAGGNYGL